MATKWTSDWQPATLLAVRLRVHAADVLYTHFYTTLRHCLCCMDRFLAYPGQIENHTSLWWECTLHDDPDHCMGHIREE